MFKTTQVFIFLALTSLLTSSYSLHSAYAQDEEIVDFDEVELDEETSFGPTDAGAETAETGADFSGEDLDAEASETPATADTATPAPTDAPVVDDSALEPLAEEPAQLSEELPKSEDENIAAPAVEAPADFAPADEIPSSDFNSLAADTMTEETESADEGPDLNYEARLYDIYVRHLSKNTSEEEWGRVVGDRTDQRYRIQRGDTLWDISQTLFGDGNYWPKIWSLNSSITNPHLIRPNNVIRFILGDESGPPAFTVTEEEESTTTTTTTLAENEDGPEIPPPTKRYNPVVKKLPPSLPAYQDPSAVGGAQYDDAGIEYGRRKIVDLVDQIPLSAYIADTVPQALGKVTEVETGYNLASSLQYIYVRMNKGEGEVGATYLSIMNRGAIKADASVVKQKDLGVGIEVLGEVQLLEKVNSEKRNEKDGDVYRALVTKTVSPVAVGSSLIIDKIAQVDLTEKGPRSQVVAQIIGGQFSNERKLYSPQSFAFLNKGENDGLQAGQILPIRLNRKVRDSSSQVLANVRAIGWLKIVRTTPKFATAVVLRAWEDIATGDYTGAGDMIVGQSATMEEASEAQTSSLSEELDGGAVDEGDFSDDETDVQ